MKNTISTSTRPFGKPRARVYAQSEQYHTIVESCVHLTESTIIENDTTKGDRDQHLALGIRF